jgi:hypothetical protein
MHGGGAGSGAPKGRRNGKYRHGGFTTEAIDERRRLASLIRDSRISCRGCGNPSGPIHSKHAKQPDELEENEAPATTDADALLRPRLAAAGGAIMNRAPFIVIDGKLYRWKDIFELRRAHWPPPVPRRQASWRSLRSHPSKFS